jgi:hypothetical protein
VADLPAQLEAALAATAAALDSGDDGGAVRSAGLAARACADLGRAGQRLPPALLARAVSLQDRCAAIAGQRMERLVRELDSAARSRRAADAYRR